MHQTSLGAKNHEHCLFFKPFKNGTMTRMTSVSKLELTGSIFRGTFSALNYDKVAEYVGKMTMYLKKGLETEGQLYLPDWEEKMAQREPSIEAKGRSPSSPRAPGKGIAQFECTVEKGPPGVGFGLIVEEIGMGQITVMQVRRAGHERSEDAATVSERPAQWETSCAHQYAYLPGVHPISLLPLLPSLPPLLLF